MQQNHPEPGGSFRPYSLKMLFHSLFTVREMGACCLHVDVFILSHCDFLVRNRNGLGVEP